MAWHRGIFVNWLCRMRHIVLWSSESNLLTVPPGKHGKYGSRGFVRTSSNLWNSLIGERAAWPKISPTVESIITFTSAS